MLPPYYYIMLGLVLLIVDYIMLGLVLLIVDHHLIAHGHCDWIDCCILGISHSFDHCPHNE
jgi:hypothetical protein